MQNLMTNQTQIQFAQTLWAPGGGSVSFVQVAASYFHNLFIYCGGNDYKWLFLRNAGIDTDLSSRTVRARMAR